MLRENTQPNWPNLPSQQVQKDGELQGPPDLVRFVTESRRLCVRNVYPKDSTDFKVGEEFVVEVQIIYPPELRPDESIIARAEELASLREEKAANFRIFLSTSNNDFVRSVVQQTLSVPPVGESDTVSFTLYPLRGGKPELSVIAWHDGENGETLGLVDRIKYDLDIKS